MHATTATHLPVGTRVRIANFAPDYDGLTGVVVGAGTNEWADWTSVAMDKRATARESALMFRPQFLVELPAPTVSLVKDPFGATPDGVAADPRPVGFLHERAEAAERLAHLEEMQVRNERTMADQAKLIGEQARLIAALRAQRLDLEQELAGARVIIEARDSRVVQLEEALTRRNSQLADATAAFVTVNAERREAVDLLGRIQDLLADDD